MTTAKREQSNGLWKLTKKRVSEIQIESAIYVTTRVLQKVIMDCTHAKYHVMNVQNFDEIDKYKEISR